MRTSIVAHDLEWSRIAFIWGEFQEMLLSLGFNAKVAGFLLAKAVEESDPWAIRGRFTVQYYKEK